MKFDYFKNISFQFPPFCISILVDLLNALNLLDSNFNKIKCYVSKKSDFGDVVVVVVVGEEYLWASGSKLKPNYRTDLTSGS